MIKQRAEQLRDGVMRSRGHALLPIMLASFIYDALEVPSMRYRFLITYINLQIIMANKYLINDVIMLKHIEEKFLVCCLNDE